MLVAIKDVGTRHDWPLGRRPSNWPITVSSTSKADQQGLGMQHDGRCDKFLIATYLSGSMLQLGFWEDPFSESSISRAVNQENPQTIGERTDAARKYAKWKFHHNWLPSVKATGRFKSTGWKNEVGESQRFKPNWELPLNNSGEIKLVTVLAPVKEICKRINSNFDHLPGQFCIMDQKISDGF